MSSIKARETNVSLRKTGSSEAAGGGKSLRMALASLGGSGGSISGAIREVAVDPQGVISHRLKEKKDMQDLNDRFATYIEKIRVYEVENKRLRGENENLRKALVQLEQKMKDMYEQELAAARKVIDETTKAKAAVELKVAGLETDLADYKKRYETEAHQHTITKENLPKLERMVAERDGQIDYMTKTITALEAELLRFKNEQGGLRRELTDMRMMADQEVVARIELESQIQSRDDEIEFLKRTYEEKIKILMEADQGDYQEYFSNELALAIRDIRAEYEAIAEAQRGADTEGWYKAKFNEMMAASQKAGGDLALAKEEVKSSRSKYAESQKELMRLRAELAAMSEHMRAMEGDMASMEKSHSAEKMELEGEISSLRAQLAAQILELKELMDSKLALDAEIATYRRLLQGEESRVRDFKVDGVQVVGGGGGGSGGSGGKAQGGSAQGGLHGGGVQVGLHGGGMQQTIQTPPKVNTAPVKK